MGLTCESHSGVDFTKKWRAETLQHGLEFDNFKQQLESGIFKRISWLNGSFFGVDDRGISKEGWVQDISTSTNVAFWLAFCLCICDLWSITEMAILVVNLFVCFVFFFSRMSYFLKSVSADKFLWWRVDPQGMK